MKTRIGKPLLILTVFLTVFACARPVNLELKRLEPETQTNGDMPTPPQQYFRTDAHTLSYTGRCENVVIDLQISSHRQNDKSEPFVIKKADFRLKRKTRPIDFSHQLYKEMTTTYGSQNLLVSGVDVICHPDVNKYTLYLDGVIVNPQTGQTKNFDFMFFIYADKHMYSSAPIFYKP